MATKVDPFVIPIPSSLTKDPETRKYFEYLNRWAHDMWVRSGAGTDAVSIIGSESNRKADTLLYSVLDKVSLGDNLSVDTTGFTADNTNFTVDMTES
jgi:hypothetical protein